MQRAIASGDLRTSQRNARASRCIQDLLVTLDPGPDIWIFHTARGDQIDLAGKYGRQRLLQAEEFIQTWRVLCWVIDDQNIDVGSLRVEIRRSGSGAERLQPRDTEARA